MAHRSLFMGLWLVLCSGLGAQVWVLDRGPSVQNGLPRPSWAGVLWVTEYTDSRDRILVYGLDPGLFFLNNFQSFDCPQVPSRSFVAGNRRFVATKAGFLFDFPLEFQEICDFMDIFTEEWNRLGGVGYYRGRITVPPKVELGLTPPFPSR